MFDLLKLNYIRTKIVEKKSGLKLSEYDLYVNVAGGVRLNESAIDLALAAALYSARTDLPCPEATALAGEISLAGEIRPVNKAKQRIKAAESLGFNQILSPQDGNNQGIADIKTLIKTIFR